MNSTHRFASWAVVVFALACSSAARAEEGWSVGKSWNKLWNPTTKAKKNEFQTPTRIVAIWSPAMYNTPGKPATRGFGGRLYFYNQKDQPIAVDGQLVVYGFNDSVQRADGRKPDRKFVFTGKQLSTHFSPAELGASYSVWIPWDGVGGPQLELSLLPVFTAANGQVVMGEQSRNLLPGSTTPSTNPQSQQSTVQPFIIDHRVAPASYASPEDPANSMARGLAEDQSFFVHATQPPPQENIRTTSIQLTRGMAERLIQERMQQQALQPGAAGTNGAQPMQSYPNQQSPAQYGPQGNPPATTYPLPAGSMPPNMTSFPVDQLPSQVYPANQAPQLTAHSATRSFNAPTADSRAWGPTVPRTQAQQNSRTQGSQQRSQTPASHVGRQTTIGQSPTRYAPGQLPAPMTASPLPNLAPQPSSPGPGAPAYLPPSQPQSSTYPSVQASWQTAPAGAR